MKRLIDVIVAAGLLAGVVAHAEDVASFDTVKATQIELGGVKTNAWPSGGSGEAQDLQGVLNEGNTSTGVAMRLTNGTFSASLADPAAAGYFTDNDYFGLTLMRRGGNGSDDNGFWLTQFNGPAITFGIDGVYDVMLCKDNVGDITDGAGIFRNGDGDEVRLGVGGLGVDRYGVYAVGGPWTAGFFTDGGMYDATLVNSDGEGEDFAARFVSTVLGSTVTVCNLSYALEVGSGDTLLQRALTTHTATNGDEIVNYDTLAGYVGDNAVAATIEGVGTGHLLYYDGTVWRNSGTSPMGNGDLYYWNGTGVGIISANWDNGDLLVFTNGGWSDLALGSLGDNLGNHTATTNLSLGGFELLGASRVTKDPNPGATGPYYNVELDNGKLQYGDALAVWQVGTIFGEPSPYAIVNYQAMTNWVLGTALGDVALRSAVNTFGETNIFTGGVWLGPVGSGTFVTDAGIQNFYFEDSQLGYFSPHDATFRDVDGKIQVAVMNRQLYSTAGVGNGTAVADWENQLLKDDDAVWRSEGTADEGLEIVNYQTMTNYVTPLLAGIVSGGSFQIAWNGPTSTVYVVSADGSITNKVGTFYGM